MPNSTLFLPVKTSSSSTGVSSFHPNKLLELWSNLVSQHLGFFFFFLLCHFFFFVKAAISGLYRLFVFGSCLFREKKKFKIKFWDIMHLCLKSRQCGTGSRLIVRGKY